MKRILTLLWALAFVLALAVPATAAQYWFQVQDENGRGITSGYTCQIYTVASRAADAIFSDTTYATAKTNPANPDSNGVIAFATNTSTVDVACFGTSGAVQGALAKMKAMTDKDHRVQMQTQNPLKVVRFFWDQTISRGAEVNTGIVLPVGAVVDDVWLELASGVAGHRMSVGLLSTEASGNAGGFCASQGADQVWGTDAAWFRCEASRGQSITFNIATGDTYYYTSNTRGVFLASFSAGGCFIGVLGGNPACSAAASVGQYQEFPYRVRPGAAKTITYRTNDAGTPGTGAGAGGWIYLFYRELRTR